MRKTGILILALLVLLGIANCKKEESGPAQAKQEVLANASDGTALNQKTADSPVPEAGAPVAGTPRIAFDLKDFDFGKVETGEKIEHVYAFRNTGDGTLVVHKVRSS